MPKFSRQSLTITATLISLFILCGFIWSSSDIAGLPTTTPSLTFPSTTSKMTNRPVTHIVMFQFKESASTEDIADVCTRMLALQHSCIHPTTQKPYILSATGGTDNSPEGLQNGITHAFIMAFSTAQDRDYYVREDPAHRAFVGSLEGVVERAQVVDFEGGKFENLKKES